MTCILLNHLSKIQVFLLPLFTSLAKQKSKKYARVCYSIFLLEAAMGIALTLSEYLSQQHISYDILVHRATETSMETAEAAHIKGDSLAKTVLLRDENGLLACVIPSTHSLNLEIIRFITGRNLNMAHEKELAYIFTDCAVGAFPPLPQAWGVDAIWDDALEQSPEIYMEGGDHHTLLQIHHDDFTRIMAENSHSRISSPL
jgi:Ala-tRNA(Pro) deacylase